MLQAIGYLSVFLIILPIVATDSTSKQSFSHWTNPFKHSSSKPTNHHKSHFKSAADPAYRPHWRDENGVVFAITFGNHQGCGYTGNDIVPGIATDDYKKCGHEYCWENLECTHFTWTKKGLCYIHRGGWNFKESLKQCWWTDHPHAEYVNEQFCDGQCGYIASRESAWPLTWNDGTDGKIRWALRCNYEVDGNDISREPAKKGECGAICLNMAMCTHFTWVGDQYAPYLGWCQTKGGGKGHERAAKPLANNLFGTCGYVMARTPLPPGAHVWYDVENNRIRWGRNCDFFEWGLRNETTESKDCGAKCLAVSECTHFTWRDRNCQLKTGGHGSEATATRHMGNFCGFVKARVDGRYTTTGPPPTTPPTPPPTVRPGIHWMDSADGKVRWSHNCDYWGDDSADRQTSSGEECGAICARDRTKVCTHFAWSNGKCNMKHGGKRNDGNAEPHPGAVCGYVKDRVG